MQGDKKHVSNTYKNTGHDKNNTLGLKNSCEKLPGESRLNRDLNPRFSTCEANVLNTDLSGQLDITEWEHVP